MILSVISVVKLLVPLDKKKEEPLSLLLYSIVRTTLKQLKKDQDQWLYQCTVIKRILFALKYYISYLFLSMNVKLLWVCYLYFVLFHQHKISPTSWLTVLIIYIIYVIHLSRKQPENVTLSTVGRKRKRGITGKETLYHNMKMTMQIRWH